MVLRSSRTIRRSKTSSGDWLQVELSVTIFVTSNQSLRATQAKGLKGTVSAHGNTGWENHINDGGQTSLFSTQGYKHWGVLSFQGLYPKTPQEIIEFHQKRDNMENFIREGKINYDLKHFPCQSLPANHAYGLLALIAHNFLRAMAILMRPDKPHFAKKLRRLMIHIPGRLVRGSGYFRMKIPHKFYEEVIRWCERWSETCKPARVLSTA